ncbi:hypothetical protein CDAR_407811, partial [Caerostris darwini]
MQYLSERQMSRTRLGPVGVSLIVETGDRFLFVIRNAIPLR